MHEPSIPQITMNSDFNEVIIPGQNSRNKPIMIPRHIIQARSDSFPKIEKATNLNRAKILVVDDENFNCDIIYGFLMILGVPNRNVICEFAYNG